MVSPYGMPVEGDIDYFFGVDCPFMRWLRENYTGNGGKAFRTHLIVKHAPGFAKSSDFAFTGFRNIVPAVRWIWKRPFKGTLADLKDLEPMMSHIEPDRYANHGFLRERHRAGDQ
jgi:hypothetical protein